MWTPSIENGRAYLGQRTGKYEYRRIRYRAAIDAMIANGLTDGMSIVDVGAGATEFDYCLRTEYGWDGTYVPIDCAIDGTDLNVWTPRRDYDWIVGMEILEHIGNPIRLLSDMVRFSTQGVVISTPDPEHTDVLGMDETHCINWLTQNVLQIFGDVHSENNGYRYEISSYSVTRETFYGGIWSEGKTDSLLGVYVK